MCQSCSNYTYPSQRLFRYISNDTVALKIQMCVQRCQIFDVEASDMTFISQVYEKYKENRN